MKKRILIIPAITILTGFSLFCFLYPFISNLINEHYNESKIKEYNKNTDTISSYEINQYFNQAEEYNRLLATDFYDKTVETDNDYQRIINSYFDILNIDSGIMGYIEMTIRLPLGELLFTVVESFGIMLAHSGFPTQKFFDNIDELHPGDTVTVRVLNRVLTYTVYGNEVVEPDDASKLQVIQNEDILTLVTCYPYGINSHRLLVHARRNTAEESTASPEGTTKPTVIVESSTSGTKGLVIGSVIAVTGILAVLSIVLLKSKKNARR